MSLFLMVLAHMTIVGYEKAEFLSMEEVNGIFIGYSTNLQEYRNSQDGRQIEKLATPST